MNTLLLARLQFAFTIGFHYIFPPLSIGLGLLLVIMEGAYLKTGKAVYYQMTRFWVRVFGLIFAIGVATGIVMEFEFGTNWATYSRFVGDVFGSALAAEGLFAFFLESVFLALLLFGWDKISRKMHFFSTVMVALGAHFSAIWIIVANSWQQTPTGHQIVAHGLKTRAEITDFWAMVFNPSTVDRLSHTIMGAWQAGAFLVISVSAYYLLKKKHIDFARTSIKIALAVAVLASLGQLLTGHSSAVMIAEHQPAKLAAFEGHFPASAPADMYLLGWVNDEQEQVFGIRLPGILSLILYGDTNTPVTGLRSFAPEDRPPVNIVFQAYHLMVMIGMTLIGLSLLSAWLFQRRRLLKNILMLKILMVAVLLPQIANQLGWIAAEVGRQPWIVYGLLRTSDALSKSVGAGAILSSLILFTLIYLLLFALFVFLLDHKIKVGPAAEDLITATHMADS
ncbi:MAG: cytochrome ubiquinol oxidase subunit I [Candidatus Marinimicrobia bacterium]|nr:cytochrome ubiquinol oxidase subunit I [Candidatus Neomarinimicrobiota bacterium]